MSRPLNFLLANRFRLVCFWAFFTFTANDAFASYRVYQLKIESYDAYGKLEKTDFVLSTLDQLQYEHYYGGYRWTRVTMTDTWYCPGDTGHLRNYCPRPKEPARGPASLAHKGRVYLPLTRQPVIP